MQSAIVRNQIVSGQPRNISHSRAPYKSECSWAKSDAQIHASNDRNTIVPNLADSEKPFGNQRRSNSVAKDLRY